MGENNSLYTPLYTINKSKIIKEELKKYKNNRFPQVNKGRGFSEETKKLFIELISQCKKNKLDIQFSKKLNNVFFDDAFDYYLTLSNNEFEALIFALSNMSKKRFKDDLTNIIISTNIITERTLIILSLVDNIGISLNIKCSKSELKDLYSNPNLILEYYRKFNLSSFDYVNRFSIDNDLSNLSLRLFYNLILKFEENDFIKIDINRLINYLDDFYILKEQINFCLYYLNIVSTKNIKIEVLQYIAKIKQLLNVKENDELEESLYIHYKKSILLNDKEITLKLGYLLREHLIITAFGEDARSKFWKQYAKKCTEAIIFVTNPTPIIFMPFNKFGVIEFIEVGNATFLFEKQIFERILSNIVNVSNHNDIFNINLNYKYSEYSLKDSIKKQFTFEEKFEHRGYSSTWQNKFKNILQNRYQISYN